MDLHSLPIMFLESPGIPTGYFCWQQSVDKKWQNSPARSSNFIHHDSPPPSPFYDQPIHFMAGPTRTEASNHRANPLLAVPNPPRPPNAWILYRSDKLKDLPQPPPGMPRKPQADISKTISAMWKSESPDVRAQYERLSDIKKAEHQAMYPGYRFQPMKKADKDRLRAEKQAEKERERGTRKTKARTRLTAGQEPTPLYTTEARFGPAGPSPPASGASTPPVSQPNTQQYPAIASQLTPPCDHPTPPADPPSTPAPPPSSPSSYPPPPSTTSIPPLVAPQPGVPQRLPSDWQQHTQLAQMQASEQDFNALWLDQSSLPDMSEYAGSQEYLTVPLPNHPLQHPLGWSPDDPSPLTDLPFYHGDPLHAVLSATDDPNVFNLGDFDVNELFDGSREIEVSMGSNMIPSSFVDMNQFNAFNSLFSNWDTTSQFPPLDLPRFESIGTAQQQPSGLTTSFDPVQRSPSVIDPLASYSFEESETSPEPESRATPMPQEMTTPYVPPNGASNSSTRRVAADWRHIRLTPDPETTPEAWSSHGR